jgi:hypothetical protein
MRNLLVLAIGFTLALATPANAQSSPQLEAGDRVRVRVETPSGSRTYRQTIVGELLAVSADSLTIRIHPGSTPFAISVAAIDKLERSYGVPTTGQRALLMGVLTGAFGAVEAPMNDRAEGRTLSVEQSMLLGGAIGTVIGAALGALRPVEHWERVPLPGEPVDSWAAVDVPRVTVSGGLGLAEREIGSGSGSHFQLGIGLAQLPFGAQLRGELTYQSTSTSGTPSDCYPRFACPYHEDQTRRYGAGLTLFPDLGRIGNRFRLFAPVGLGVFNSHVSTMERHPQCMNTFCPAIYESGAVAHTSENRWGVMGNLGFHAALRLGDLDAFAEVRAQIVGESGSQSAVFIPLALGVSF